MSMVQQFAANLRGRDFIIGDLHGQLGPLQQQLIELGFDAGVDRLFSVGDLIDRGPQSKACLQLVLEPWFFAVMGNHEDMLLSYAQTRRSRDLLLWQQNGGSVWTDNDLLGSAEFLALAALIATLPIAIEVALPDGRRIGITHAERPCRDWLAAESRLVASAAVRGKTLWSRAVTGRDWGPATRNISLTVHGHVMVSTPFIRGNAAFIDTGAGLLGATGDSDSDRLPHPRLSVLQLSELFALPRWSRD